MIRIQDIVFRYQDNGFAIDHISMQIRQGERVSIVGPNGSGKTTLMKIMLGVLKAPGEVRLVEKSLDEYTTKDRAKVMAYMPQFQALSYSLTVKEYVELGRYPHTEHFRGLSARDDQLVQEMMELMNLQHYANRSLDSLSGGERQRVFLAKALVQEPKILFLDEPITYLDLSQQLAMLKIVKEYCENKNISVVAIMHDLNLAMNFSHKIALLSQGKLADFGPPKQVLTPENVKNIFGINVNILDIPGSEAGFIIPDLTF